MVSPMTAPVRPHKLNHRERPGSGTTPNSLLVLGGANGVMRLNVTVSLRYSGSGYRRKKLGNPRHRC